MSRAIGRNDLEDDSDSDGARDAIYDTEQALEKRARAARMDNGLLDRFEEVDPDVCNRIHSMTSLIFRSIPSIEIVFKMRCCLHPLFFNIPHTLGFCFHRFYFFYQDVDGDHLEIHASKAHDFLQPHIPTAIIAPLPFKPLKPAEPVNDRPMLPPRQRPAKPGPFHEAIHVSYCIRTFLGFESFFLSQPSLFLMNFQARKLDLAEAHHLPMATAITMAMMMMMMMTSMTNMTSTMILKWQHVDHHHLLLLPPNHYRFASLPLRSMWMTMISILLPGLLHLHHLHHLHHHHHHHHHRQHQHHRRLVTSNYQLVNMQRFVPSFGRRRLTFLSARPLPSCATDP